MPNAVTLSLRDVAILRLLDRTPATSRHLLKLSSTFVANQFKDERRTRERLQRLESGCLIRRFPVGQIIGGPVNWYKLTPEGWRYLHGSQDKLPHRAFFDPIPTARFEHARTVADVIVHLSVAAQKKRVQIAAFHGDGQLLLETASGRIVPDCHFQLQRDGCWFNLLFEIDNSNESLTTNVVTSIRSKLSAYELYQDTVWQGWKMTGKDSPRPYFRVVFLTKSVERSNNILWLASQVARNRDRHLVYSATQDTFLASGNPLFAPVVNDHHGEWRCLSPLQPTAKFMLTPIRIQPTNVPALRF